MPANKKTKQERFASTPFILHLDDEPYELTAEGLKNQADESLQKKRNWSYPTIKFISLSDQILKLRISDEESFEMTVKIEPYKLHISCSCGSPVLTLCIHTFQTLKKIILFEKTDYFKQFMSDGLVEIALANKKHFKVKRTTTGLSIQPADTLGTMYKIADKMGDCNFPDVLNLPQETVEQEMVRLTDLTYIILYSSRDKYFPFLLPCVGILNKAGTDIKGFYNFITTPLNEYDAYLTNEQKELNALCLDMWMEAKNQSGSIITCDAEQTNCAVNIFNLWNKALPILRHQPFVYLYNFYHRVQLKNRPQKGRLQRVYLSREKPYLHFQLIDNGPFYQLEMKVSIKGDTLRHFDAISTFFIGKDKALYMLSSLKDAGITEWMRRHNNRITVFKEHFNEFEKQYLEPLSNNYRLEIIPSKK
jgi:hypothetical protein